MKLEELFELLDKTCKLADNLHDDDCDGYELLTSLVAQLSACVDDDTIEEGQPGFNTVIYLIGNLIDRFNLEW